MIQPQEDENDDSSISKPSAKSYRNTDLPDNAHDEERMQPEEVILELPDVNEIPGQEHIHVPQMREMQDVTIASDDEEGVGIFGDDEEDEETRLIMGTEADVQDIEEKILSSRNDDEEDDPDSRLTRSQLDETDADGVPLNEGSSATNQGGSDLDISGGDDDDPMENIGEEDEENNYYSLGGDDKENLEGDKS